MINGELKAHVPAADDRGAIVADFSPAYHQTTGGAQ
jgi:hypothetical protein